jgi:nucleotide-binding universal stress UspA family protein
MFELGTDGPSRILVGVDGSATSMRAGAYAGGLARRQGSALIILFVIPTNTMASTMAATAGALIDAHHEIAESLRTQIAEAVERIGVPVTFLERRGNPYVELVRAAEQLRVDAIVIGASMQSGHKLVGSLAGRLVRDAKWPVTVVP